MADQSMTAIHRGKIKILRLSDVCKITGLGRSMIYQMESEFRFPARVRIGSRAVGWVESEVQGWLEKRIELCRVLTNPSFRQVHR